MRPVNARCNSGAIRPLLLVNPDRVRHVRWLFDEGGVVQAVAGAATCWGQCDNGEEPISRRDGRADMNKPVVAELATRRVLLLDSITWLTADDAGHIVISGSHGGRSAGEYAVLFPLALCCMNDAGVGKDRAGIVALDMLEARDTPGLAFSHDSARIGEARDAWDHGVVSHVNAGALALGIAVGRLLREEIQRVFAPQ